MLHRMREIRQSGSVGGNHKPMRFPYLNEHAGNDLVNAIALEITTLAIDDHFENAMVTVSVVAVRRLTSVMEA